MPGLDDAPTAVLGAAPASVADPSYAGLDALSKRTAPTSLYEEAAVAAGLDSKYGDALQGIHKVEAGGEKDPWHPKASSTGAQGPFQFTKGTWGQYGQGNILDPHDNTYAAARYLAANLKSLTKSLGREPTYGELGLAHQQGAEGALSLINNPGASAGSLVGSRAVAVNGGNPNQTAGSFAQKWINAYGKTTDANGAPSLLPPTGKDPSELALDAMAMKEGIRRRLSGEAPASDAKGNEDWSFGMQMLDSLLQGNAPQVANMFPSNMSGGSKEKLEAAREEWQKNNPGKTIASDLSAGSVPALAATALTEGVAAPALARVVPSATKVLDFLTGKTPGLLSKIAQGGEQGAIAGAISQRPGADAESGSEMGEVLNAATYGAGKVGGNAARIARSLAHSPNAIPIGLAAMVLGHDPLEVAHMVYQHPELATAILGGAGIGSIMNKPGVRNAIGNLTSATSPNPLIEAGIYAKPEGPFGKSKRRDSGSIANWFGVE